MGNRSWYDVLILVLMEYGLRVQSMMWMRISRQRLNPCFNGIWSARRHISTVNGQPVVLILVLMEYGLRARKYGRDLRPSCRLNPCFNGIWSASGNLNVWKQHLDSS